MEKDGKANRAGLGWTGSAEPPVGDRLTIECGMMLLYLGAMKNRSIAYLALGLSASSFFSGCSTDLDVQAPYKEITVVYSLLNWQDDTLWIKINKAFLGDGNAFDYAQIPDSNEYSDAQFSGVLEQVTESNGTLTAPIQSRIVNRPVGIFNGPEHKMYFVTKAQFGGVLEESATYNLIMTAKGNAVRASTLLVEDFSIRATTANITTLIAFRTVGGAYSSFEPRWNIARNGKRYEVSYRFNYDEVSSGGAITAKSFTSKIGTVISDGSPGAEINSSLNGELFYQTVGTNVAANAGPDVVKRVFQGIELLWSVAGPDLHTYLILANPISGVVEERPDYSNVENGYGLFSSRLFKSVPAEGEPNANYFDRKKLSDASNAELRDGPYTNSLNFCIPGDANCP